MAGAGGVPQGANAGNTTNIPAWALGGGGAMPQGVTPNASNLASIYGTSFNTGQDAQGPTMASVPAATTVPTTSAPGQLYVPEIQPGGMDSKMDIPKPTSPKKAAKPKYTSLGYYNTGPSGGGYAARDTWGGDVWKSDKGQYFWDNAGKYAIPNDVRARLIGLK